MNQADGLMIVAIDSCSVSGCAYNGVVSGLLVKYRLFYFYPAWVTAFLELSNRCISTYQMFVMGIDEDDTTCCVNVHKFNQLFSNALFPFHYLHITVTIKNG